MDNAALTGESEPQSRSVVCTNDNPLETANLAFSGTSVVDGGGVGVFPACSPYLRVAAKVNALAPRSHCSGMVIYTGDATVIGQLAGLVSGVEQEETPLNKEINRCA